MWCETLAYDALDPALAGQLARRDLELLLAVRPWQLAEIPAVVRRLQDHGVFVGVWPMLADADGRWASARSHAAFIAFADALVDAVPFANELVIDLEPPKHLLARWKDGDPTWRASEPPARRDATGRIQGSASEPYRHDHATAAAAGAWRQTPSPRIYEIARAAFTTAIERWRARMRVSTAILPMLAFEVAGEWMQRLLGTPTSSLAVDHHSVMAYTSLLEGWSRGLVSRRRAERLLVACARLARRRFGDRAGLSLGTVGTGAFGDEPCYRDVGELARDVALAREAGITELSLFDLGGIVRRPPIEPWLEAFTVACSQP